MTPRSVESRDVSRERVRRAAGALRRLFQARPAGLLTDVDGTISRIVDHTNDAMVSTGVKRALTRLTGELDLVAIVTGRAVERARRMVGVVGAYYVGNHGLEWLRDGVVETDPAAAAARPALDAALRAVRAAIPERDLIVEDKRASIAIHYRLAAHPEQVGRHLRSVLAPMVQVGAIRIIEGMLVVNLLPALEIDKGTAARRLIERHGLRSVAFFGDDLTDLDAFRTLSTLRSEGSAQALTVGVGGAAGAREVRAAADLVLEGVDEVERVLAALAARPPGGRPAASG
jgi:trehalose 6-phosphate phosphatase